VKSLELLCALFFPDTLIGYLVSLYLLQPFQRDEYHCVNLCYSDD
jgi:hypothetical protein